MPALDEAALQLVKILLMLVQVFHGHLHMCHHLLGLQVNDNRNILLELLKPTVEQVQHVLLPGQLLLKGLAL